MHRGHRRRHGRGRCGRPFPNRHELLARLEAHQRDLEQEVADLDDLIRHLRDESADAPSAATTEA